VDAHYGIMTTETTAWQAGKIIFLNGTSSAGKTTLAHALQEVLPEPWLHVALDQYRDGMPARFRGLNSPPETEGALGLNVIPVTDSDTPHTDIRFGDYGQQVLRGMRRNIRGLVEQGLNVIIDDIILEPAFLEDYLSVFEDLTVLFVAVRCPRTVINARESQRPGRFPGTAIGHFESCHAHGTYDIEVDTGTTKSAICAEQIAEALFSQSSPTAFQRLQQHRAH